MTALKESPQHKVKDRFGNEWDLTFTLDTALRLDSSDFSVITKQKLCFLQMDNETMQAIVTNRPLLAFILYAVCIEQVKPILSVDPFQKGTDEAGVPYSELAQRAFLKAFPGPVVQAAARPFAESLGDFFPEMRTGLLILLRQIEVGQETANLELEKMETELGTHVQDLIRKEAKSLIADLPRVLHEKLGGTSTT